MGSQAAPLRALARTAKHVGSRVHQDWSATALGLIGDPVNTEQCISSAIWRHYSRHVQAPAWTLVC